MKTFILRFIFLLAACVLPVSLYAQASNGASADANSGSTERFWARAEYLHWWMKGNPLPALVTTSPPGTKGTLPGAETLFGGDSVDGNGRNGGRLSLGYWLDDSHQWGLDASVILIGFNGGSSFSTSSNGTPVLARPFFNVSLNAPDSLLVAAPGVDTGSVSVSTSNELQTVSAGLRRNLLHNGVSRIDLVGGYRYFHYQEALTIEQTSVAPSVTISGYDFFSAGNTFNGGEVGLAGEWNHNKLSLNVTGKIALGDQHGTGQISGQTTFGGTTAVGDLLALSSNIGRQTQDSFSVLPEVALTGRYSFHGFGATLGYTALFLNNALRTSGLIDQNINPTLLPPAALIGVASPKPQMNTSVFWAQGISVGLDYRF